MGLWRWQVSGSRVSKLATLEAMEWLKEELGEGESQGVSIMKRCMYVREWASWRSCMPSKHQGEDRGCLQEGEFSKREEISKKITLLAAHFWKICCFGLSLWVPLVLMQDKSNNNSSVPVSPVDVTSEVTQMCPTPATPWTAACGLLCAGVFQVRTLEGVTTRPSDKRSPQRFLSRVWGLAGGLPHFLFPLLVADSCSLSLFFFFHLFLLVGG